MSLDSRPLRPLPSSAYVPSYSQRPLKEFRKTRRQCDTWREVVILEHVYRLVFNS